MHRCANLCLTLLASPCKSFILSIPDDTEDGVPYDETPVVPDFRQLQTGTREGLVEFLQRPDRPSAIFAVNDYAHRPFSLMGEFVTGL
jgi:hypothetical protein